MSITFKDHRPFIIAGPCSAETEAQVLQTAHALVAQGKTHLFRSGIWKPRTRPNSFEGVGEIGLAWLSRVKQETGLPVTTEVANRHHVHQALQHEIDVLWIGARTTGNPFSVQEIADALRGVDIPVMVKNPITPDVGLWRGAVERLQEAGVTELAGIHRGFSSFGESMYRNQPRWQLAIEFKRQLPDLPLFIDPSHICGRREILGDVAQRALDLNYDGMMVEVHPEPDAAWSDARQQVTPNDFASLLARLNMPQATSTDPLYVQNLAALRQQIEEIDEEVINLLGDRMKLAQRIGDYKRANNIAILQPERWASVLQAAQEQGKQCELSTEFVTTLLEAIHHESILKQEMVKRKSVKTEA